MDEWKRTHYPATGGEEPERQYYPPIGDGEYTFREGIICWSVIFGFFGFSLAVYLWGFK